MGYVCVGGLPFRDRFIVFVVSWSSESCRFDNAIELSPVAEGHTQTNSLLDSGKVGVYCTHCGT